MRKWLQLLVVLTLGCNGSSAPSVKEKAVSEPLSGTVEALLAQVEALPDGTESFEIFVPQALTMNGRPVDQNVAMTVVLDRLLGKGLFPDGFVQQPTGCRYKYKR